MPRGGARVGAGRKPRKKTGVVIGMDGTRLPSASVTGPSAAANSADLAQPPANLSSTERTFWERYAPYAIDQGTLTVATAVGFRELCEQWGLKDAIAADIAKKGAATRDAEGSLRTYVKLAQRVDASLARFKLTAFGKAAEGAGAKKPAANPWAQVAAK